jgi:hypothetical protein
MQILYFQTGAHKPAHVTPLADCIRSGGSIPMLYDPDQREWYDDALRVVRVYTTDAGAGLRGLVFEFNDNSAWTARTIAAAAALCGDEIFNADLSAIDQPEDRALVTLIAAAEGRGRDYAETARALFPQA